MTCKFKAGSASFPVSYAGYVRALEAAKKADRVGGRHVRLSCGSDGDILLVSCRRKGACSTKDAIKVFRDERLLNHLVRARGGVGVDLDTPIAGTRRKKRKR
jgi:hypothetical protein